LNNNPGFYEPGIFYLAEKKGIKKTRLSSLVFYCSKNKDT